MSKKRVCPGCKKGTVQTTNIPYNAKMRKQGEYFEFSVPDLPIEQCGHCKEQWMTHKSYQVLKEILKKKQ